MCWHVLVCVEVHCVPHDAGVIGQDDKGPDVIRRAPSLQTPTALQLQVVIRELFNQEVSCACRRIEIRYEVLYLPVSLSIYRCST